MNPTLRKFLFSTAVLSVVLVVAVDLWLSLAHPLAKSPTPSLERGEVFLATQSYDKEVREPSVIVLGSSLVTAPIIQEEAKFHNVAIPRFTHRRSHVLEQMLSEKLGGKPEVFCLAVGGEMASDAYLITKHIFKQGKTPIAVVYGIAPRDFQDNLMPGVQSSETFRVLADVNDVKDMSKDNLTFDQQAGLFIDRLSALSRYRADIRTLVTLRAKKLMEATLPFVQFEKLGTDMQLHRMRGGWFPEEAKGTPHAAPNLAVEHLSEKQATYEYIRRYNPLAPEFVDNEFGYLKKLLQLCDEHAVPVVLVNMPLSAFNKKLMAAGYYEQYLNRVQQACHDGHAEFIDFNTSEWDTASNFIDTVHLKPEASHQFLDALSAAIAKSQAAIAIRKSNKAIAASSSLH